MNFLSIFITVSGGEQTERYTQRFTSTFKTFPPGADNWGLMVVSNGGPIAHNVSRHFTGLDAAFLERDNSGWDLGAYIEVANGVGNYDFLLCCGQSVYFHRRGWLARLNQVCQEHGAGLYGFYASNLVAKHLNTTCFCVSPQLLRGWNQKVETKEQRYAFEHHPNAPFWRQVEALRRPVRLVMWNHDLAPWQWRAGKVENEFWRGDQSQCLMWCSHTDRYQNATKSVKTRWTHHADRGLQQQAR